MSALAWQSREPASRPLTDLAVEVPWPLSHVAKMLRLGLCTTHIDALDEPSADFLSYGQILLSKLGKIDSNALKILVMILVDHRQTRMFGVRMGDRIDY